MSDKKPLSKEFNEAAGKAVPVPRKSFHEQKIESLQKQRRYSKLRPGPKPKGVSNPVLSKEDRQFNEALDRQIKLWKNHARRAPKMRGKAREDFEKNA